MTGRPLPMMLRMFVAMVAMVIAGSWVFGRLLGVYQDRAAAAALAPLWVATIRSLPPPEERLPVTINTVQVQVPVELRGGQPPEHADSLSDDGRTVSMVMALRDAGLDVREMRLDGRATPAVTWLDQRLIDKAGQPVQRWVGIVASVQPSDFRRRWWLGVGALVGLVLGTAWLVSRWVALPLARLAQQVERIARGETAGETVRGAREIGMLGAALTNMARQRDAFDTQRRTMLMGVSHDLRSPLTRIRVAVDLLDDPASARLRDLIVQNVVQADAIIESFAEYVRTEAEPIVEEVDLRREVVAAGAAASLPPEAVALPDGSVTVRGNVVLLQRLIANLLDNALRHGAQPVQLALRIVDANWVEVVVQDAGAGIADPERMLQPFERGDAARRSQGTGLGLAIATRIVERHGGRLDIGRAPLGGARVAVTLPRPVAH